MNWPPDTAAELRDYIRSATAYESHQVDFKRELGRSRSQRRATAEHLASFAASGGWLIVGVDEDKGKQTLTPHPIPLTGERERVDQIAFDLVDPPIFVASRTLRESEEDGEPVGFLVVRIPPSPSVVHAVNGRYVGRRDVQKARLSDVDVERLIALRSTAGDSAIHQLQHQATNRPEVDEDYYEVTLRLVPRHPDPRPLWGLTHENVLGVLEEALREGDRAAKDLGLPAGWKVGIGSLAGGWRRRPGGVARVSEGIHADRTCEQPGDTRAPHVEFLFDESGALQLWLAWLCVRHRDQAPKVVVADQQLVHYVACALMVAAVVSDRIGFDGQWTAAITVEGIHLGESIMNQPSGIAMALHAPTMYTDPQPYERATTTTAAELEGDPTAVVRRLLGSLLRALDSEHKLLPPDPELSPAAE